MIVVADVFSMAQPRRWSVQAPRNLKCLPTSKSHSDKVCFRSRSLDRRPGTMRVVFSVQKVDVRDQSF